MKSEVIDKLLKFWSPVFVWAAIIFSFSAKPTNPVSEIYWKDFVVKKLAHVVVYAILAIFLYRAFKKEGVSPKKSGYYSIIVAVLYGLTDEFHQSYTPGRDPKLRDVIFDTIGATFAIYGIWNILPKTPSKLKRLAENLQLL